MSDAAFSGFPAGFADFLFSLQFSNTIERLPENKVTYQRLISEPLKLLFQALTPGALGVSGTLVTRPSKCVSTMYSDMRFSRDTPLKGYMYIRFREPYGEKDILGLYFDMGCDNYSYGIRIYKQSSAGMERIRAYALEHGELFTQELEHLKKLDMTLFGDEFAKDHYPGNENEALKDLLNRRGFYIGRDCPIDEAVYDGRLPGEINDAYCGVKGLYSLLKKALYEI